MVEGHVIRQFSPVEGRRANKTSGRAAFCLRGSLFSRVSSEIDGDDDDEEKGG